LFYDQSFVVLIVVGRTYNAMRYNDNREKEKIYVPQMFVVFDA